MKVPTAIAVFLSLLFAINADGGVIVKLGPADAKFNSSLHGYGTYSVPAPTLSAGLAFNVTFTPAAGDLDSTSAAVNVIEVGGDANGTGMYLLGGELHFLSKMSGNAGNVPGPFDDLDFSSGNNMIGAKSSFGKLVAGTTYTVAAVYDPVDASPMLQLGVQAGTSGTHIDAFTLTGVGGKTNWVGDRTTNALQGIATNAGGGNTVSGNPFSEAAINSNVFAGTKGQALYWNATADIVVPEPTTLLVWSLLAGLGVGLGWRRRK
jgi:hypothetical protein